MALLSACRQIGGFCSLLGGDFYTVGSGDFYTVTDIRGIPRYRSIRGRSNYPALYRFYDEGVALGTGEAVAALGKEK